MHRSLLIRNGDLVLSDRILRRTDVLIRDRTIAALGSAARSTPRIPRPKIIDAKGYFVAPGFIDTHIHGEPDQIFRNEVRYGTTSIVPAISCASLPEIRRRVERIERFAAQAALGSSVLGVRLEGPFISRKRRGAQKASHIRAARPAEAQIVFRHCGRSLRMITIAPELKGSPAIIRFFVKKKVIVSLGHSDATLKEAVEGIDAGISHATHIFNAMRPIDRREPAVTAAALFDRRVTAEIILDKVHVHPALFSLLVRTKGLDRIILVTDSIVADRPRRSRMIHGAFRLNDGTIAGSALTMNVAVRHAVESGGISLPEAVRLATANPARLLGIYRRKGSIAAGKDADIVIFDRRITVRACIIQGAVVYAQHKDLLKE